MGGAGPNWAEIAAVIVATAAALGTLGSRILYSILGEKINAKSEELHRKIDAQRTELHTKVDAQRVELLQALSEGQAEMSREILEEGRNFGESLAAIRTHIGQVELYIRDNFVRRDEFQTAMVQLSRSLDSMRTGLDDKLERIRTAVETKIEKIN